MRIKYTRLFTGDDDQSHFEEGFIDLNEIMPGVGLSAMMEHHSVQLAETAAGGTYDWHCAPRRQLLAILAGTVEFETRLGETQIFTTGDLLIAEDLTGGGHRWKLIGKEPWRRLYVHLESDEQTEQ
jgi:hypothetical protein